MLIFHVLLFYLSPALTLITTKSLAKRQTSREASSEDYYSKDWSPTLSLLSLNILKHEALLGYDKLQQHLSNNDDDCFPGSFAFNGSCIYFSTREQRLSWQEANQFCQSLPLNTSFLTIETASEFEFVRKTIVRLKVKEEPVDQLVFLIGFSLVKNRWRWISNKSLEIDQNELKLDESAYEYLKNPLGSCGSLALTRNYDLILKSAPCETLKTRFICKYNLNPCYNNNVCGTNGKCVNFYQTFYCDCEAVSIFYAGKYCEKLNSKAIQTIAAILFIFVLSIYICLQTKQARKLTSLINKKLRKLLNLNVASNKKATTTPETDENQEEKEEDEILDQSIKSSPQPPRAHPVRSISKILETKRQTILQFLLNSYIYGYILLVLMVILLTLVQVVLIDMNNLELFNLKRRIKNNSRLITHLCANLERNYYTEEIIYLLFALLFFLLLIFKQKKRRFSNYIIKKFRNHPEILEPPTSAANKTKTSLDTLFSFIPSFSFSTTNRTQSASVYIIYTYDVLNIFMFIYASDLSSSLFPLTSDFAGVLFDFCKQILQVLLIGVKFYPILIVADLDPSILIYLATSMYISLIWAIRFINKAFCSHKRMYFETLLSDLLGDLNRCLNRNIRSYQRSNRTGLGIFRDSSRPVVPTDEYVNTIRNVFPKIFAGTFEFDDYGMGPSRHKQQLQSTTKMYLNEARIINKLNAIHRYGENEFVHKWIGLAQNLPFYITISYLLTRYGLLFTASLIDKLKELFSRYHASKLRYDYQGHASFNPDYKSAKNLNDIIDVSPHEQARRSKANLADKQVDELAAEDVNILGDTLYSIENNNYKYIFNLLNKRKKASGNQNSRAAGSSGLRFIEKSFLYNLFEKILSRIYTNVPHMKFSKQLINTYTVAFMIVYFFTLFGIRLASLFNDLLAKLVDLASQYIYGVSQLLPNSATHNFLPEIRTTCALTSLLILIQLCLGIKSFQQDLLKLHKAENVFGTALWSLNTDFKYAKIIKRRNRMSSEITSDSIHFPGYLIAHLVYGYLVLFTGLFGLLLLAKFLYHFPNVIYSLSQVVLPLVIMVVLKLIIVQFMTKFIFLRRDGYRIGRSVPYHTIAYFNFFFDCFLGMVTCMSRVWLTNLISLLTLTRLDVSVFNKDGTFLVRRLDKGYLAYVNYVRMEHWYNNPVVNGFCEMLAESMLNSKLSRLSLKETEVAAKVKNVNFDFKSYLKLRNLFYLVIVLRNAPFLRQHRHHHVRLRDVRRNDTNESFFDSFDRQKKKFSNRGQLAGRGAKVLSKEAQLYDLLRMKNDMIIKQNLERIMIEHGSGSGRSGGVARNREEMSMREFFLRSDEVIMEGDEAAESEGEEVRLRMDDTPVYNLKKTRFMH